jgi:thioredoxin-related protein
MLRKSQPNSWLSVAAMLAMAGFFSVPLLAQKEKSAPAEVNWVQYDKGLELGERENRHILVDFYTSWCGWCKKMDKDTYADAGVRKLLSQYYVPVKLNAESQKALQVNGKSTTERGVAKDFRVTGYPTTCFLKPNGDKIACLPGYAGPEHFSNVLSYIKDKAYEREIRLDEYLKEKEKKKAKS